ncbi:T9SS type A sorting domain-containing protein [Parabacteroides sp.]
MRTIYHIIFIVLFFNMSISGQNLQGTGTDYTGGKAEIGQEYNYKLINPNLISDSVRYLKWNVNNGKIVEGGNGSIDAKIKWTGFPAFVTISDMYEKTSDSPKSQEFDVTVIGNDDISKADYSVSISKNFLKKDEWFKIKGTASVSGVSIRLRCSGTDFVLQEQDQYNCSVTGSFSSIGFKSLKVEILYNNKVVYETTKPILVISDIVGADVVCSGLTETYTVPNLPAGVSVNNWTLTEDVGLYIVSGQGTNTITVRSNSYGNVKVNANVVYNGQTKTLSKSVLANTPRVQTISGPTGSIYVGSTVNLTAYPQYPSSICTYEWSITPTAGANISSTGATAIASVLGSGTYEVRCRVIPSCGVAPTSMFASYRFTAEIRTHYKVSLNSSSRQICIVQEDSPNTVSVKNQNSLVQYELYRMETGVLVKKNSLPVSGGTIEAAGVSNGLYLLKIVTGEAVESHKIILK